MDLMIYVSRFECLMTSQKKKKRYQLPVEDNTSENNLKYVPRCDTSGMQDSLHGWHVHVSWWLFPQEMTVFGENTGRKSKIHNFFFMFHSKRMSYDYQEATDVFPWRYPSIALHQNIYYFAAFEKGAK